MLRRAAGSAFVATWLALAPVVVDLVHPLLVDCAEDEVEHGLHHHPAIGERHDDHHHDADDGSGDRSCCPDRHPAPASRAVGCCAGGGCFCCGAAAVIPGLPAAVVPASGLPDLAERDSVDADGIQGSVFRPPRA